MKYEARAEFCQIFRSFFGQWSFKKKCFWDLLTFSKGYQNSNLGFYSCPIDQKGIVNSPYSRCNFGSFFLPKQQDYALNLIKLKLKRYKSCPGSEWILYYISLKISWIFMQCVSWAGGMAYWTPSKKWYFVTKIVLTYCEKKLFYWSRKTFEIRGWRPRICKKI